MSVRRPRVWLRITAAGAPSYVLAPGEVPCGGAWVRCVALLRWEDRRAGDRPVRRLLAIVGSPRTAWVLLAMSLVLAVRMLVTHRRQALDAVRLLDAPSLAIAVLAAVLVVACSAAKWRAVLADLGHRVPAGAVAQIFLLGQVGKYLPGSVWSMVTETQLAARFGVSRRRALATSVTAMLVSIGSAAAVILVTLPLRPDVGGGTRWLGFLLLPAVAVLHPAVLGRVIDGGLRLVRREPLHARTSLRGSAIAFGWGLLTWVFNGVLVFCIAHPLGLAVTWRAAVLVTGGYAMAWLAGLVVVVAPVGVGIRDGALVVVLATALPLASAIVVALVARLVLVCVDLALAAPAVLAVRRVAADRALSSEDARIR
jgi:uncharacterized membrane protein YbhN (UPF0104 family)